MITPHIYHITGQTPICSETPWRIKWNTIYSLPPYENNSKNKGVAGAFSGYIDNELIVAGGAYFPDKTPWDGGKKHWTETLYQARVNQPTSDWKTTVNFLPQGLAYGVSIQLPEGVLCIGGCNAKQCFNDVFLICKEEGVYKISSDWPSLPVPLANATGKLLGNKIYIAGGQESMREETATVHFFVLDIKDKERGWQSLPSWPGAPRGYAVSAAFEKGAENRFYLFSGRNYNATGYVKMMTDGFVYDCNTGTWTILPNSFPVMAGTAITMQNAIVFFGGVTDIIPSSDAHPGFSNTMRIYDVEKKEFIHQEELPFSVPVTTNIAIKENRFYITSGEIKPGIRTPLIFEGEIIPFGE